MAVMVHRLMTKILIATTQVNLASIPREAAKTDLDWISQLFHTVHIFTAGLFSCNSTCVLY